MRLYQKHTGSYIKFALLQKLLVILVTISEIVSRNEYIIVRFVVELLSDRRSFLLRTIVRQYDKRRAEVSKLPEPIL
jgi:hypothetical protein